MKSEQINELAKALSIAQGAMGGAAMDKQNPFLKSKYADLGSVIEAAKKPLAANGLSVSQLVSNTDNGVSVETILMHSSGQWLSSEMFLPVGAESKGTSLAQQYGGLITYLRRYSYAAIVGIYSDEDTDGNGAQAKQATQPSQQSQPKPMPTKRQDLEAKLKAARDECRANRIDPPALTPEKVKAMSDAEIENEIALTRELTK